MPDVCRNTTGNTVSWSLCHRRREGHLQGAENSNLCIFVIVFEIMNEYCWAVGLDQVVNCLPSKPRPQV
jgi:hypothetical protein